MISELVQGIIATGEEVFRPGTRLAAVVAENTSDPSESSSATHTLFDDKDIDPTLLNLSSKESVVSVKDNDESDSSEVRSESTSSISP
jgi:hypothetical protein